MKHKLTKTEKRGIGLLFMILALAFFIILGADGHVAKISEVTLEGLICGGVEKFIDLGV